MKDAQSVMRSFTLMLVGVAICFVIIAGYTVLKLTKSLGVGMDMNHPRIESMSSEDADAWNKATELFALADVDGINDLLRIGDTEIVLEARPAAKAFSANQTPMVEVIFRNVSGRTLNIFEPRAQRLTLESYESKGVLVDEYTLKSSPQQAVWCRALEAGKSFSLPVLVPCESPGKHQVKFSLAVDVFEAITRTSKTSHAPVIAHTACSFKVKK